MSPLSVVRVQWSAGMQKTSWFVLLFALSGCLGATEAPEVEPTPATEIELTKLLPADAELVGVAITPEGKRYVLDQRSGLYELGGSSARLVFDAKTVPELVLTDVVALDESRFALTAVNDGFLLNLDTSLLTSYFCYLPAVPSDTPDDGPVSVSQTLRGQGIDVSQRTDSVAFNPATRQLFAQPRTTRLDTGATVGSELFLFAEQGGQPIQVLPLADLDFVAGGMAASGSLPDAGDSRLILGAGNSIYEAASTGSLSLGRELEPSVNVTGMARGPNDSLWYLDGNARRLVSINDRF
jgi:hypothetical protein